MGPKGIYQSDNTEIHDNAVVHHGASTISAFGKNPSVYIVRLRGVGWVSVKLSATWIVEHEARRVRVRLRDVRIGQTSYALDLLDAR